MTFPTVQGTNLEHRTFRLPADFAGERNLVVVAFQREQQEQVATWTPFIQRLLARETGLRFYEVPTTQRGNPLFRFWVDRGMRSGIADRTQREQTITLFLNKAAFRQQLGLPDEHTIYALLVDRAGHVLWRTEGRFTEEKGRDLERVLGSDQGTHH